MTLLHPLPRSFRRPVGLLPASLLAAWFCAALDARAQDSSVDKEFTVQRFNPAPGPRNFFTTRTLRMDGEMTWSAGLFVNYANEPFVLRSCRSETNCEDPNAVREQDIKVIENLVTGDLLGSLTPFPRLQVGLRLPVTWVKGHGLTAEGTAERGGMSAVGMGDAELEAKARLVGEASDTFVAGAALFGTGPLGRATAKDRYIGDATPTVGLRAIFDGLSGPLSVGGNFGAVYRGEGRVGTTDLGPEFRYGAAAGYQALSNLRVVLDGFGSTKFSARNGTNAFELDGGIQFFPSSPIVLSVGGGTGLIQGVGVPKFRVFAGFLYVHEQRDSDGDGIPDDVDQCPNEPEDRDGFEDSDGCPDPDNDGDTIADAFDKCPNEAEDFDGFEDTDGCPDPDNDKDGIPDERDACPNEPETMNGYKDEDGCPDEPDRDGDGVPDSRDKCPDEPEDTDGFEDEDGCPDPDNDGDGIPDNQDECIDEPETYNGYQDQDGCPDTPPPGFKAPPGWKPPELPKR
jgi:OmpA-OmpF porin, OOP family